METALARVERELERIDLLLRREVMRLRTRYHLSLDEFRGLYISDQQVDELLRRAAKSFSADDITGRAESIRARNDEKCDPLSAWGRIASGFKLGPVEQDLLFLALAPDLDPKYEKLYGYLNDDVSQMFVTRDLARRMFAERGTGAVDRALAPGSSLLRSGLLVPTATGKGWHASPILRGHVLAPDAPPIPPLWRCERDELKAGRRHQSQIRRLVRAGKFLRSGGALVLSGIRGSGRLRTARRIAELAKLKMLVLDARDVTMEFESVASLAGVAGLQSRLDGAALYIRNTEAWFDSELRPYPAAQHFLRCLGELPLCLACAPEANWRELIGPGRAFEMGFAVPSQASRETEWTRAVTALRIKTEPQVTSDLARQFVLTSGQIAEASQLAADTLLLEPRTAREALFAAARAQSTQDLGRLAQKITTCYRWNDLVLPPATASQLRHVAAAICNRGLVYEGWGISPGTNSSGLNVLFSGASGTGKTMSAAVIASDAGIDLYRVNLAGVVSKYIGETEKNLDRIFTAARHSNGILFFDEADALFGKRSEVQDARDRYANIEVAYLLQKLEQHDGVLILASNLARNLDEAFSRRIQFHVEFPLPAEPHRERLWRGMFPPPAPVDPEVDFAFLARQFHLTGGQIRTVSVDAAFLAAADGGRITMPLIIKALARNFVQQGRMPTAHQFGEYFSLVTETTRSVPS